MQGCHRLALLSPSSFCGGRSTSRTVAHVCRCCRVDGQTQTQLQQPVAWRHCADPDPQRGSPDIALTVVAPAKCDNAGSAGAGRVELRVAPGSRRPLGRGAGSPLRGGGPPQLGGSRLPAPHQRSATVARWRGNNARGTACCVPAAAAGAGQQHRRWGRGVAARGPVHGGGPVDAHRHLRLDPQLLLAPAAAPCAVLADNFAHRAPPPLLVPCPPSRFVAVVVLPPFLCRRPLFYPPSSFAIAVLFSFLCLRRPPALSTSPLCRRRLFCPLCGGGAQRSTPKGTSSSSWGMYPQLLAIRPLKTLKQPTGRHLYIGSRRLENGRHGPTGAGARGLGHRAMGWVLVLGGGCGRQRRPPKKVQVHSNEVNWDH